MVLLLCSTATGKEEEILAHRIPSQVQYVLIGAGTASHACAKAIRECDPKAKVSGTSLCLSHQVHVVHWVSSGSDNR